MDNTQMHEVDTFIMTDADGKDTEYAIVEQFEYKQKKYLVAAPIVDGAISDDDGVLYRYSEDGDEFTLEDMDDDEFEAVSAFYDSLEE